MIKILNKLSLTMFITGIGLVPLQSHTMIQQKIRQPFSMTMRKILCQSKTPLKIGGTIVTAATITALLYKYRNPLLLTGIQHRSNNIVRLALSIGADPNFINNYENGSMRNPALMWAALLDHAEIVQQLLNRPGININHADIHGDTALTLATRLGHTEIVRLLLNKDGIDINHADNSGYTALIWAAIFDRTETVQLLLNTPGININHADNNGDTALTLAAYYGYTQTVQLLLNIPSIDINHATNSGYTALIWAAGFDHTKIVQLLLEAHADFTLQNNENMTAQDIALRRGHHVTANLIRNYQRERRILAEWALKNCENKRKLPREIRNEITEKYLGHPKMDPA